MMRRSRRITAGVARVAGVGILIAVAALAGCSPPVGITRVSPRAEHRQNDASALSAGEPSDASQTVLRRHNLTEPSMPIPPSVIPVEGDGPLVDEVDGVVAYRSAHIEGVESECVIHHSSHSTQSNPVTIDEVRRILLLQAAEHPCAPPRSE